MIWLATAAVALILTVVYLNRLQELYAKADQVSGTGVAGVAGVAGAAANDATDSAVDIAKNTEPAGDSIGSGDNTAPGPDAGDGGNAGNGADAGDSRSEGNGADTGDGGNEGNGSDTGDNGNAGNGTDADPGSGNTDDGTDTGDTVDTENTETGDPENTGDAGAGDEPEGGSIKKNTENFDYSLGIDPEKPIIALSFDDGPSVYTERIIAALEANNAEATFFMVGYNVRNYKDVVKQVYDAGMEIGNHTTDHKKLSEQSKETIRSQVFDNEDLINSIVPAGRIIVRPPYGSHNSTVRSIVQRPMFNWSVDSLDWKTRNADSIVAQIKQDARDGYIVLMHDLYETTAEAAERIIPWLIDQGYQVTGRDRDEGYLIHHVREKGAEVMIGHHAENVHGADFVVYSAAIPPENPERTEAERLGIPSIERAELLGQLMEEYPKAV